MGGLQGAPTNLDVTQSYVHMWGGVIVAGYIRLNLRRHQTDSGSVEACCTRLVILVLTSLKYLFT